MPSKQEGLDAQKVELKHVRRLQKKMGKKKITEKLNRWKAKLLDLTKRNRLLAGHR